MDENFKVPEEIERTIKGELEDMSLNAAELALDSTLNEGLLSEIPIVGTLVSGLKVGVAFWKKIFTKKLLKFLKESSEVPSKDRIRMIEKINSDPQYETKVGEQLLMIIYRADDYNKASIIGRLFRAFLQEKIDYARFLLLANVVNRAHSVTLERIKNSSRPASDPSINNELFSLGLLNMKLEQDKISARAGIGQVDPSRLLPVVTFESTSYLNDLIAYGLRF